MSRSDVLRSPAVIRRYKARRARGKARDLLHLEKVAKWRGKYWFISANEFPYNRVARMHDLLIPYRVFEESTQMRLAEAAEYRKIKAMLSGMGYDTAMENTHRGRSVDTHFHVHLVAFSNVTDLNHG